MRYKSYFSFGIMAAAALGLTVACGSKGDSKSPVKELNEQEKIYAAVMRATGGKYDMYNAENLKMAARLEAASATIVKTAQGKDAKDTAYGVQVRFLLKDIGPEISARKELVQREVVEPLTNDPGVPSKYTIEAVCGGADCDNLFAVLSEKDETAGAKAVVRKVAVIFKREKSLAQLKRQAEQKTLAKGKDGKSQTTEDVPFDETQPVDLEIRWSASPDANKFMGGMKTTIEQLAGSQQSKAHKDKWPQDSAGVDSKGTPAGSAAGTTSGTATDTGASAGSNSQRAGVTQDELIDVTQPLAGSKPMGLGGIGSDPSAHQQAPAAKESADQNKDGQSADQPVDPPVDPNGGEQQ